LYQAHGRFGWPAAAPVLAAAINLGLVAILARPLGVLGVAVAALASLAVQAALLLPIALRPGRFRPEFNWRHPGAQQVIRLLTPLVLSNLLVRSTPIVDRYVASGLPEGSISHLGYAYRIMLLMTVFLANGIATVLFPRMAVNMAGRDKVSLGQTISLGLRLLWLVVAPAMALCLVLSFPLIAVVFQRGAFSAADAQAVAVLLQVYAVALVATCLGNITGRAFYAMQETRILAVMGALEAGAYAIYTPLLGRSLGAQGVAWAYVAYFSISLGWQVAILRHKLPNLALRALTGSLARTGLAAAAGGFAAWGISALVPQPFLALLAGGTFGVGVYGLALFLCSSAPALSRAAGRRDVRRGCLRPGSVFASFGRSPLNCQPAFGLDSAQTHAASRYGELSGSADCRCRKGLRACCRNPHRLAGYWAWLWLSA
jgi:putative peptidoglycan lipid II flippase